MATLSKEESKKRKRRKLKIDIILFLVIVLISPLAVEAINSFLLGTLKTIDVYHFDFNYIHCVRKLFEEDQRKLLCLFFVLSLYIGWLLCSFSVKPTITTSATVKITPDIEIPAPVGNGQYGNAWFLSDEKMREAFGVFEYTGDLNSKFPEDAGIIVQMKKEGNKEIIYYLNTEANVTLLGSPGSGKTRNVLIPSIWFNIMCGVSQLITDPKGTTFLFTHLFAKARGCKEITIDFREPEKSMRHNFLQDIINYLNVGDVTEATDRAWDMVSLLVGEAKGEKIWNDGECATICAAILIVASDAPEECKNLPNVYYFLSYMCEADENGNMPINAYLEKLPRNHPARAAFQVAKIAPSRTRGSFFTSALATLRLFTNYKIADMSSKSDFSLDEIDDQKTIIYVLFPDEKTERYPLVNLFIAQTYEKLIQIAKKKGGTLDRRFIYRLDEAGQLPVIPGLGSKVSAGRERNIFFELGLQEYSQLKKYKDDERNVRGNSLLTIFLKTAEDDTSKALSEKCHPYTCQSTTASSNQSGDIKNLQTSYGTSAGLMQRALLMPEDIEKINKPYGLVMYSGFDAAIVKIPDLSEYYANKDFGLGDKQYNREVLIQRENERPSRNVDAPVLWEAWKEIYPPDQTVSFLDEEMKFDEGEDFNNEKKF